MTSGQTTRSSGARIGRWPLDRRPPQGLAAHELPRGRAEELIAILEDSVAFLDVTEEDCANQEVFSAPREDANAPPPCRP
jgi:hypothetical protein